MRKKLYNYIKYLEENLSKKQTIEKEAVLTEISFYQHERLVHLIVTCFIGIIAIICLGLAILFESSGFIILFILSMFFLLFKVSCNIIKDDGIESYLLYCLGYNLLKIKTYIFFKLLVLLKITYL